MTDYWPQSPWSPHDPPASGPSIKPNPTAPAAAPDAGAPAGGGAARAGQAPPLHAMPIGKWILNLSIAGAVVGCIAAVARALILHTPASELRVLAVRYLLAGAAAGAGFPPAFRAGAHALRAVAWIALAAALWLAALLLAGQADWLLRLR